MSRSTKTRLQTPSEFLHLSGIEYFQFEEDFVEENVRCIPMIVRFKMDAAGIKLRLSEWSKFNVEERVLLAVKPCSTILETKVYNDYLNGLIFKYTGTLGTPMKVDMNPPWAQHNPITEQLAERINKEGVTLSIGQWQGLSNLQRFALLKLCREGHESKNFIKALKEFEIVVDENMYVLS